MMRSGIRRLQFAVGLIQVPDSMQGCKEVTGIEDSGLAMKRES